ncbi:hypothetical protein [Bradyrhizobium sp. SZCCHNR2032]|uniref:hypothetical protein n=1 Tax=Bradyrhizobium sp. SZCCHNR2032 TaxID=3057384 RepID=UPI002916382E|nr:hypothetical protein [Bradyrhizobium sp. SZCCHNR2032]
MDFERQDAIAQRSGSDRLAAHAGRLKRGKGLDLLEEDGAKEGDQRQAVLVGLAEAGEHSTQDQ